ncbi:MAG TPA: hypothetical protein VG755_01920 [Nannocystaceae bacterium]|nr:hypothetical protein [Nannocystaceae bacterium]
MSGTRIVTWATIGALLGACDPPVFLCDVDADCVDGRRIGVCEVDGWCSFANASCPTGRAYGEHAPDGLARRCTMPIDELGSTGAEPPAPSESSDEGNLPAPIDPRRDDATSESSSSADSSVDASSTGALDACTNGARDDDEADVDCGGACSPCELCKACSADADCIAGASCVGGACRVFTNFITDWETDCNDEGEFLPSIEVPPGEYLLTATQSAGSKWISDTINGGNTWAWWLDCKEVELDDLRTPIGQWYADPGDAFDALLYPAQAVELPEGKLSCGVIDNACTDNRGGVAVAVENVCPSH